MDICLPSLEYPDWREVRKELHLHGIQRSDKLTICSTQERCGRGVASCWLSTAFGKSHCEDERENGCAVVEKNKSLRRDFW